MGRSPQSDVILDAEGVEMSHAAIECDGHGFRVRSLSEAPVSVNGEPITSRRIRHGDTIELGDCVLDFRLYEGPSAPEQPSERELRAYRRSLVELSPDAIVVVEGGTCSFINSAGLDLLNAESADEVCGRPISEFAVEEAGETGPSESLVALLARPKTFRAVELRVRCCDGSVIDVEASGAPVESSQNTRVQVIMRDITERKELTARMMQMDRMIAVGTLAAGIGHEINNPLSYVLANIEYCTRLVRADGFGAGDTNGGGIEQMREALQDSREGIHRVRDIVKDLRTFSRSSRDHTSAVNVEGILESSVKMASHEIGPRAQVLCEFEPVPAVRGCESRLGQVFLNLLINAAQAIEAQDNGQVRVVLRPEGGQALVQIQDNGPGIPADALPRIFDPFFSTKLDEGGTGLGLSICRNIVEDLGASLDVDSTPGEGATFSIRLPFAEQGLAGLASSTSVVIDETRARVLLIDDEAQIGRAVERLMDKQWDVVCETDAVSALERLAEERDFDVILCDLMMPRCDGVEFMARLEQRFPEMAPRVVFMTGGAYTERADDFLGQVDNICLQKPLSADELADLTSPNEP